MTSRERTVDSLLAINKTLMKAGKQNASKFLYAFLDREDKIVECLKHLKGVKSEIYLREIDKGLDDKVRFSSIFSDITVINAATSLNRASNFTVFEPQSEYWRDRKLNVPSDHIRFTGTDPSRLWPCYMNRQDDEIKELFHQFSPLVQNGRMLIRPLRGLYVGLPNQFVGNILHVDPNTPNDFWHVNSMPNKEFIAIENGMGETEVLNLFELTLPYFEHIQIEALSKVLDEENSSLSAFRSNLKSLLNEIGDDPSDFIIAREDLIRPSIDEIERKFKSISQNHRVGVRGALSSFTLTLAVAQVGGNLLQVLCGAAPATIGAILLSDRIFNEKLDGLKDNRFYLLWRISRRNAV